MASFIQSWHKKPDQLSSMTEITDYLYLGSVLPARYENVLKEKRITHVINGIFIFTLYFEISVKEFEIIS